MRDLCQIYDMMHLHIRSLKSTGVATESEPSFFNVDVQTANKSTVCVVSRIVKENETK